MSVIQPFTEAEVRQANSAWGANCGPTALAFALQTTLDKVRPLIPRFAEKRFTNPTMMREAIHAAGRSFRDVSVPVRNRSGGLDIEPMFEPQLTIVRVQFTGPWTAPGANKLWAYRFTHWITTWAERSVPLVFDCNGGILSFDEWERDIVPEIIKTIPKADGGWHPTHIWRLR